jgi:hypothetical protein
VTKKKAQPAPEPDYVTIVKSDEITLRGRTLTKGMAVKVTKAGSSSGFKAAFMYAYVDEQTGEPYEITVYGGTGFSPGQGMRSSGVGQFRTVYPERIIIPRRQP